MNADRHADRHADRRADRRAVALAVVGLLLVLGLFNGSVWQKERLLADGASVTLQLAPRDPRSLLTGDYMALEYSLARELHALKLKQARESASMSNPPNAANPTTRPDRPRTDRFELPPQDGYAIIEADARGVARLVREQPSPAPLAAGQQALKFRVRDGTLKLGSNAFYFEEGQARRYEPARYGQYRVDASGEMLLVRLLDEALKPL